MRNITTLLIALMLVTVNSASLAAKPRKSKAPSVKIQRASRAVTQIQEQPEKRKNLKKSKKDAKAAKQKPQKAATQKTQGKSKEGIKKSAQPKTKKSKNTAREKEEAQKLKAVVKEWQQCKKDMEPLQLKDLVEENHRLKTQNRKLEINVQELALKLKTSEDKVRTSEQDVIQLTRLENELDTLRKAAINIGDAPIDLEDLPADSYRVDQATGQVFINGVLDDRYGVDQETGKPFIKGILFKVQISASKELDLSHVLVDDSHHKNLEQEKADGLNKYTMGHFRNYWEADKLKKGLRSMGIRRAWIVPYKDGKRVLLKEVLNTVIDKKKK